MLKDVLTLSRLQLCNLFGLNEIIHTRDKGKKIRYWSLSIVWLLLIAMVVIYVGGMVYGLHLLGVGRIAPMYLYTVVSLVLFVLSFFKAGSLLFSMKFYDVLISLPVSRHAILISRFLSMYVTNLLLGFFVMLPGVIIHGYFMKPGISFYLIHLLVILFTPLLPLTISSIIGAVIKAISSRMRHKKLIEAALTILLVIVLFVGSMAFSGEAETMDLTMLLHLVSTLTELLGSIYTPALWFNEALRGNIPSLFLVIGIPTLLFALFIAILAPRFQDICAGLNASHAKHNYKLEHLQADSILISLWKREGKLYFSSSLYVTNTIVGYVLAVLMTVGIAVAGLDSLTDTLEIPQLVPVVVQYLPFILALPLCMTGSSSCAISMEGKTFWQLQVLPIPVKDIYLSKILWNLTLALPFYLVSAVLLLISVHPTGLTAVHYLLLPLVYLMFTAVLGLAANLWFPLLNWETEARVVKQSAAVLVSMLGSILSILLPAVLGIVFMVPNIPIYLFVVEGIIIIVTIVLYLLISKKELLNIQK